MSIEWPLAVTLHQVGSLIWVGGMFFAHFALRPAANTCLSPAERLPLMQAVFDRFFVLVWLAIVMIWTSGLWIFLGLYDGHAGWHVHAMMGLAAVMTVIFAFIWYQPYRALASAIMAKNWLVAGAHLALIRRLILTNLALGLITAILGAAGPTLIALG